MKFNAFGKSDNFFVTRFYFQCGICVVFHLKLRRLSHLFYSPWKIVLILFYYLLLFGLVVAPFKSLMSYKYSYYFQVIFKLDGSSPLHLYLPFLSCYLVCSLFFCIRLRKSQCISYAVYSCSPLLFFFRGSFRRNILQLLFLIMTSKVLSFSLFPSSLALFLF